MSAPASIPARRLSKQLAEARRIADALTTAVEGVTRVGVTTHADGSVTVSLRVMTAAKP